MSLISGLVASLGPTIAGLAGSLGVTVNVYRAVATKDATGRVVHSYPTVDASLGSVSCFLLGKSFAERVEAESVHRPSGVLQTAASSLMIPPTAAGTIPVINAFDGIKVMDGAYAGWTFIADSDGVPDLVGLFTTVKLANAPAGKIV